MINVLVVENQANIIQGYKETIRTFFAGQVNCEYAANLEQGLQRIAMLDKDYAGAIIDLRLDNTETDGAGGNQIIRQIKSSLRFPIFVLSGHTEDLEEDLKENTPLFQCIDKASTEGSFQLVINRILSIHKTGITQILSRKGQIEQYIQNIFWKHLSTSMPYWIEQANAGANTEPSLLRYTLTHLQEYLEINAGGEFEDYYPIEFYINPPIKQHEKTVFTADIFQDLETDKCYIVLTPSCDLVQRRTENKKGEITVTPPNATHITFGEIENLNEFDTKWQDKFKERPTGNQLFHYVPPTHLLQNGGVINFSKVKSIRLDDVIDTTKYVKVFAVSNSFAKDIIARFSHYYARQGQPGLRQEIIRIEPTAAEKPNSAKQDETKKK
jgi:hypothetical protein